MVHPPCSGNSDFPCLGRQAWVGEGARGSLVGQGCVAAGGSQLRQVSLQVPGALLSRQ